MDRARRLITAGTHGLSMLEHARNWKTNDPDKVSSQERIRSSASRDLRRAIGATVNDLDFSLFGDLFKIVRRLRKGTEGEDGDLDRVSLAVKLTQMTLDKKRPPTTDNILWIFNKIYGGLHYVDFGGMAGKLKGGIR